LRRFKSELVKETRLADEMDKRDGSGNNKFNQVAEAAKEWLETEKLKEYMIWDFVVEAKEKKLAGELSFGAFTPNIREAGRAHSSRTDHLNESCRQMRQEERHPSNAQEVSQVQRHFDRSLLFSISLFTIHYCGFLLKARTIALLFIVPSIQTLDASGVHSPLNFSRPLCNALTALLWYQPEW
jgi:hypothetical protein